MAEQLTDITRRQKRILTQVEDTELDHDEDATRGFVRGLRQRYAELEDQRRTRRDELRTLEANPPRRDHPAHHGDDVWRKRQRPIRHKANRR